MRGVEDKVVREEKAILLQVSTERKPEDILRSLLIAKMCKPSFRFWSTSVRQIEVLLDWLSRGSGCQLARQPRMERRG